jgi:hypothetical protein
MKVNTSSIISVTAGFALMVLGFQNCGQTRFSYDEGAIAAKAGAVSDPGAPGLTDPTLHPNGDVSNGDGLPNAPGGGTGVVIPSGPAGSGDTPVAGNPASNPPSCGGVSPGVPSGGTTSSGDSPVAGGNTPVGLSDPNAQLPAPALHDDAMVGNCSVFKGLPSVMVIPPNAKDIVHTGSNQPFEIDLARNVTATGNGATVLIMSAQRIIQLSGNSAVTTAHANEIPNVSGISSHDCLYAGKIGHISGGSDGGDIVADKIDEISGSTGNWNIHYATIGKITGASGHICLYNGAKFATPPDASSNVTVEQCD